MGGKDQERSTQLHDEKVSEIEHTGVVQSDEIRYSQLLLFLNAVNY